MLIRLSTFVDGIWSLASIYFILSDNDSDCRGVSFVIRLQYSAIYRIKKIGKHCNCVYYKQI